jgi:hypothetical protein
LSSKRFRRPRNIEGMNGTNNNIPAKARWKNRIETRQNPCTASCFKGSSTHYFELFWFWRSDTLYLIPVFSAARSLPRRYLLPQQCPACWQALWNCVARLAKIFGCAVLMHGYLQYA